MTVAGVALFATGLILVVLRLQDGIVLKVCHPMPRKSLLQRVDLIVIARRPRNLKPESTSMILLYRVQHGKLYPPIHHNPSVYSEERVTDIT